MRTVIAGGTIVTAASTYQADVLIDGGRIALIGKGLGTDDTAVVDAAGKFVFPGALDVHTHLETPWGTQYTTVDDWRADAAVAETRIFERMTVCLKFKQKRNFLAQQKGAAALL